MGRQASTSANGLSAYLKRNGIEPVSVREDALEGRGIVVVNCLHMPQANFGWHTLKPGPYTPMGHHHPYDTR